MDRLNKHRFRASLDIDVAQGAKSHSPAGVKVVQESFGGTIAKLLLDHPEQVGFDRFKLKVGAVADTATALRALRTASLQRFGEQAATLGQRLVRAGGDLTNGHAARVPGHNMSTIGDVDLSGVVGALDSPALVDGVKLGMQ